MERVNGGESTVQQHTFLQQSSSNLSSNSLVNCCLACLFFPLDVRCWRVFCSSLGGSSAAVSREHDVRVQVCFFPQVILYTSLLFRLCKGEVNVLYWYIIDTPSQILPLRFQKITPSMMTFKKKNTSRNVAWFITIQEFFFVFCIVFLQCTVRAYQVTNYLERKVWSKTDTEKNFWKFHTSFSEITWWLGASTQHFSFTMTLFKGLYDSRRLTTKNDNQKLRKQSSVIIFIGIYDLKTRVYWRNESKKILVIKNKEGFRMSPWILFESTIMLI